MSPRRSLALLVCLAMLGLFAPTTPASAALSQKGTYHPVASSRVLDTRTGVGAVKAPLGANAALTLTVGGQGGVPASGVQAVVLNVTVQSPTASSYLAVYPSGGTRPTVSTINFQAGWTRANIATVGLSSGGKVDVYNRAGSTSVIIDVTGYYAADDSQTGGNEYMPTEPNRLLDTRQESDGALPGKIVLTNYLDFGDNGDKNSSVRAVAVNVTATGGTSGYLTLWDGVGGPPNTSAVNFRDSGAIANLAVVKTALCTDCPSTQTPPEPAPVQFSVYNGSTAPVHVIIDLVGVYYSDGTLGLRFQKLTPQRISDSRIGQNGATMTAGSNQVLTAPSAVAGTDTVALVTNVTAVAPTERTYFTLYTDGAAKPISSNVNAAAGTTVANGAVVELSPTNKFDIYNGAGTANFLVDVTGSFVDLSGVFTGAKVGTFRSSTAGQDRHEAAGTR